MITTAQKNTNKKELTTISEDPLEEIRNANKGKETEIRKAIKEALKWKK